MSIILFNTTRKKKAENIRDLRLKVAHTSNATQEHRKNVIIIIINIETKDVITESYYYYYEKKLKVT